MSYKNKEKQAQSAKKHYENNKDKIKERAKTFKEFARKRNRDFVDAIKNNPCSDCGFTYPPYVMQFDHIGTDKIDNISNLVNNAVSLEKIKNEIEKCELVCSNCHASRTYNRRLKNK